jgi:hypothetical protein
MTRTQKALAIFAIATASAVGASSPAMAEQHTPGIGIMAPGDHSGDGGMTTQDEHLPGDNPK